MTSSLIYFKTSSAAKHQKTKISRLDNIGVCIFNDSNLVSFFFNRALGRLSQVSKSAGLYGPGLKPALKNVSD